MSIYKFKCLPGLYTAEENDILRMLGFKTEQLGSSYVRKSRGKGISMEVDMDIIEKIGIKMKNIMVCPSRKIITLGVRTAF